MPPSGGLADKIGNRYEGRIAVWRILLLLDEQHDSVRVRCSLNSQPHASNNIDAALTPMRPVRGDGSTTPSFPTVTTKCGTLPGPGLPGRPRGLFRSAGLAGLSQRLVNSTIRSTNSSTVVR
jgi:hypothetical protein